MLSIEAITLLGNVLNQKMKKRLNQKDRNSIMIIGRMDMGKKPDIAIQKAIQHFAVKSGLFDLMTDMPTTPNFM